MRHRRRRLLDGGEAAANVFSAGNFARLKKALAFGRSSEGLILSANEVAAGEHNEATWFFWNQS